MQSPFFHRALIGLLGLSLLLKVLVPAGFMPDMEALSHGTVRIMICSADGEQNMTMDTMDGMSGMSGAMHHDHEHEKHGHVKNGSQCPFGFAPVSMPLVDYAAIVAIILIVASILFAVSERFFRFAPNLAARSRAPPFVIL